MPAGIEDVNTHDDVTQLQVKKLQGKYINNWIIIFIV